MKKIILAVLMVVMVATPCLAEVETDSFLTLERTLWHAVPILGGFYDVYLGFSMGKVYFCEEINSSGCSVSPNSLYLDLFLAGMPSIFYIFSLPTVMGWTLPIVGIGGMIAIFITPFDASGLYTLTKVSDTWSPPEKE